MPGLTGHELLAAVRENHPDTVRVMLTGDGRLDATVDAFEQGGVFRFLNKPCDVDLLDLTVLSALDQRAGRSALLS